MRKFDSINDYLSTVNSEEKHSIKWNIERLMVEYWEVLTKESSIGEDNGKITIPVGNYYLIITINLKWQGLKMHAIVQDVRVLDTVEWIGS